MLVLTRRTNERIIIGQDIVITVLKVQNDQVRIGIEAPRHIEVHREEVYRALHDANIAAAGGDSHHLEELRRSIPAGGKHIVDPDQILRPLKRSGDHIRPSGPVK